MFADYGQQPPAAQPSFVEIPNPRVTTTRGRIEVTNVRPENVMGFLLDSQDNPILECGHTVYVCLNKVDILCLTEQANVMSRFHRTEQALTPYTAPKKYSLESLRNENLITSAMYNKQMSEYELVHVSVLISNIIPNWFFLCRPFFLNLNHFLLA